MTKKEIRKSIKAQKEQLTKEQIRENSHKITRLLLAEDCYKKADVIYPYIAYNQEILTDEMIEDAWKSGKKVAVPRVIDDHMEFFYITSFDDLELGYCDIPEPKTTAVAEDQNILILMPGLAFDRNFNRIGYGGGFYDRYLDTKSDRKFTKVAFAYDFQLLEHVETEEHDYKIDALIIPDQVFKALP